MLSKQRFSPNFPECFLNQKKKKYWKNIVTYQSIKEKRNFRWVLSETSRPFLNKKGTLLWKFWWTKTFYHKHKHVQKQLFIEETVMSATSPPFAEFALGLLGVGWRCFKRIIACLLREQEPIGFNLELRLESKYLESLKTFARYLTRNNILHNTSNEYHVK